MSPLRSDFKDIASLRPQLLSYHTLVLKMRHLTFRTEKLSFLTFLYGKLSSSVQKVTPTCGWRPCAACTRETETGSSQGVRSRAPGYQAGKLEASDFDASCEQPAFFAAEAQEAWLLRRLVALEEGVAYRRALAAVPPTYQDRRHN